MFCCAVPLWTCRKFDPARTAYADQLTCARAEYMFERGAVTVEQLVRDKCLYRPAEAAAVNAARAAPLQRKFADRKRDGRGLFFPRAGRVYVL